MKNNILSVFITLGYFYLCIAVPFAIIVFLAHGMGGSGKMSENYSFLKEQLLVYLTLFIVMFLYTIFRKYLFILKDMLVKNKVVTAIVLLGLTILLFVGPFILFLVGFFLYAFSELEKRMQSEQPNNSIKIMLLSISPLFVILIEFLITVLVNR